MKIRIKREKQKGEKKIKPEPGSVWFKMLRWATAELATERRTVKGKVEPITTEVLIGMEREPLKKTKADPVSAEQRKLEKEVASFDYDGEPVENKLAFIIGSRSDKDLAVLVSSEDDLPKVEKRY
jgi:hypothetical protein